MRTLRLLAMVLGAVLVAEAAHAQARLIINNQSQRDMTVKVVRTTPFEDSLHTTMSVAPHGEQTIGFSQPGEYFLKTMATLAGRDPIYQRGSTFRVYIGPDGYSVLTITFTIVESATPQVMGGKQISRQDFERDSRQP
jgi:hypothetical protein